MTQIAAPSKVTTEKRKASASPDSEVGGTMSSPISRPIKTRIIVSTESPEDYTKKQVSEEETGSVFGTDIGTDLDEDPDLLSEQRVTRTSTRKMKE